MDPNLGDNWWGISPDGSFSFLGQDDTSLRRVTITLSPDTSIDTLLARAK